MHGSSHPAGLLHASSCGPHIQVPPSFLSFPVFPSDGDPRPASFPHPARFSPSCGVLSKLRRMDPGAPAARYSQLLDCACSWDQAANVLELITDWLTQAQPKQGVSPAGSPPGRRQPGVEAARVHVPFVPQQREGSGRRVRIQETAEAKPELALAYLDYLLNRRATREKVLALEERRLRRLHTALGSWRVSPTAPARAPRPRASAWFQPCLSLQAVLDAHLSGATGQPSRPSAEAETALGAFVCHGRLGAHLQHSVSLAAGRDGAASSGRGGVFRTGRRPCCRSCSSHSCFSLQIPGLRGARVPALP